jgi:hypothetical protein
MVIEPRRAPWRELTLGSQGASNVLLYRVAGGTSRSLQSGPRFGEHGWRPGIITGLGKNRGDNTVGHLRLETDGKGRRVAGELRWRKPEVKGQDKPGTCATN